MESEEKRYSVDKLSKLILYTLSYLQDDAYLKNNKDSTIDNLFILYRHRSLLQGYNASVKVLDILTKNFDTSNESTKAYIIFVEYLIAPIAQNIRMLAYTSCVKCYTSDNCETLFDLCMRFKQKVPFLELSCTVCIRLLFNHYYKFLLKKSIDLKDEKTAMVCKINLTIYSVIDDILQKEKETIDTIPYEIEEICRYMIDIPQDKEKIKQLEQENIKLKETIECLKTELIYKPDGEGMKDCETNFYANANKLSSNK